MATSHNQQTMDSEPNEVIMKNELNTNEFNCMDKKTNHQETTKTNREEELTDNTNVRQNKGNNTVTYEKEDVIDVGVTMGNGNSVEEPLDLTCSTPTQQNVHVCQSCQHLYNETQGVVLTANTLHTTHHHVPSYHERSFLQPVKSWKTCSYDGLYDCPESQCSTSGRRPSVWQRLLPRNEPWWPYVKITVLVICSILPFVFLVVYFIFAYKK